MHDTDEIKHYKRLKSEARNKLDDIINSMASIKTLQGDIDCYRIVIERLEKGEKCGRTI